MKSFLRIFKSQATKILIGFKVIRLELTEMQHDLERLLIMEQNVSSNKKPLESIVSTIRDSFGVALWIKDSDHRYIFANKICCETILKCREEELGTYVDEDFEKDPLVQECMKSDKLVMKSRSTMRFIEYAVYENGNHVFLDVVKSPRLEDDIVLGTIGSGVIITDSIPKGIRNQKRTSHSIEIPLNASMGPRTFVELLERRKDEKRAKSDDNKYQLKREECSL